MASENETKHVKRKPTRIHPINALWNMNTKVRGGDSELFVSRQPQTGVNTKSVGNSKSKIGGERLPDTSSHRKTTNKIHPINENWNLNNKTRVGGSELFLSRKPHPETNTKSVRNSKEVGNLPDISTRKIRERLIHLLGLKSQTKIELYSILQRQGLRDCERKVISTVLGDIAQFSHNSYSLRNRIWREVDVNWPYYTEKELQQMKMNKERSLRAPNKSDKVTSVPSKSSTSTSRTRPSQLDGNNTLKSSLRAPNKSDEVTSVSSNSSRSTSRTRPSQLDGNNSLKSVDVLKRPNEGKSDSQPSKKRRSDYTIESIKYDFNVFTEITNSKQYSQYKAAYDRYFEEYLPLWQQIEELKRSFRGFGIQILNVPVDHPDYERKQRFDYLHAKLNHIGQLITKSVRNSKEVGNLPDISTRKIRERLIHLLGLKSQTKIELYSILQRQGLRDCESKVISTVLRDIAEFSHNSYSLRIRIWREVDENWPYYTEKELQQMKMNKERSLRAPNKSDKVTSVPSKSSTSTSRTRPSQLDGNNTLKSSLRAPNKSDEVTSVSSNSSRSTSRTRPSQLDGNNTLKSVDVLKRPNEGKSDSQPSKKRRSDYTIESIKYSFNVFTEITNSKQYSQYKAAYDRYFEEYLPLWQQIEELKRSFREFGIQILNVPVDHPDYERKQRFDYLHAKLDHIGQLITAYEENTGNKASFYNTSCKVIYVEHA